MTIIVLHPDDFANDLPDPRFRDVRDGDASQATALLGEGRYVAVATVETDDLEKAFDLTSNGPTPSWSRDPLDGCTPLGGGVLQFGERQLGYKSAYVGDLMIRDGEVYMTMGQGFQKLDVEAPEPQDIRVINGGHLADAAPAMR